MNLQIRGDDSIGDQARTYAEYRLFAALSQAMDIEQVRSASLVLRRVKSTRQCDAVVCIVTVELHGGEVARLRAAGDHPYAAINRAVDRLRLNSWSLRSDPASREIAATD